MISVFAPNLVNCISESAHDGLIHGLTIDIRTFYCIGFESKVGTGDTLVVAESEERLQPLMSRSNLTEGNARMG